MKSLNLKSAIKMALSLFLSNVLIPSSGDEFLPV